jgi:hypothetical protein
VTNVLAYSNNELVKKFYDTGPRKSHETPWAATMLNITMDRFLHHVFVQIPSVVICRNAKMQKNLSFSVRDVKLQ